MNENRNIMSAKEFDMDRAVSVAANEFLPKFGYDATERGVRVIANNWWGATNFLRGILRKHSNWDESQQAIIWNQTFEQGINKEAVENFACWASRELKNLFKEKYAYVFDMPAYTKARTAYKAAEHVREKYHEWIIKINDYEGVANVEGFYKNPYPYLDMEIERFYTESVAEYEKYRADYENLAYSYGETDGGKILALSVEHDKLLRQIASLFNDADMTLATDEWAERVNELNLGITCHSGEKVTRVINKIAKKTGLDKIVKMETVFHNGVEEQKNFGWNYQYAALCDALSPLRIDKYTVLSINMFDYWTMSFGPNWSSCHTIDRNNSRHVLNHQYHGCYSAGTESYMLDETSVIFYTVDKNYKGEMWKADKDRRMMFHIDPSGKALVFGRLYPDGRDGGETGFAAQFRQVVQKILSECVGFSNLWVTKKGTCEEYVDSFGSHYRDYEHYSDCGYSYAKELGSMPMIRVGHNAICPCCGEEHYKEDSIQCEDCDHPCDQECERCGAGIDTDHDDYIYCEDNGHYYCSERCAHNDGVYYCVDDNEWHDEDNWYMDDYDNRYYHDEDDRIDIEEYSYHCTENAENDGWRYCEDESDWYRKDDCYIDDYDNLCYHDDSERIDIRKCNCTYTYHSAENAEFDGWTLNEETNEWERV